MKITLTIERFDGQQAILKDENGLCISWPKDKLPAEAKEKEAIVFNLDSPATAEAKNKKLAKDILNEILNAEL